MKYNIKVILLLLSLLIINSLNSKTNLIKQVKLIKEMTLVSPFLIDSLNVNGDKYSPKILLSQFIPPVTTDKANFKILTVDTANTIKFDKPDKGFKQYYVEFRLYSKAFSKPKLMIASTTDFTVYVNGEKKDGSSGSDLKLVKANQKDIDLTCIPQYYTVGINCLVDSKLGSDAVLKLAFSDDSTKVSVVDISSPQKQKLAYEDLINFSAPYQTTISYKGTYILNKISTVLPGGDKTYTMELTERATGKLILKTSDRLDADWLPKTEKLYYIQKLGKNRVLTILDPVTLETNQLVKNLPEGAVYWSPNEKYLIISNTDKYKGNDSDTRFYIQPQDRNDGWRNGSCLSRYDIETGQIQLITYGNKNVYLQTISNDGQKIIFSTSRQIMTKRPFNFSTFYQYSFENQMVDTLWKDEAFIHNVQYSPDDTKLLVSGAPAAFNKLGEDIGKMKYSNDFDVQAYLYDLKIKKVTHLTHGFNPTINDANWNTVDGNIYFKTTDRDYETIYRYITKDGMFQLLPLQVDVVQQFDLSGDGRYAVYRGVTASYPSRAFSLDMNSLQSKVISDPEKDKMQQIDLGKVTNYDFKSKDGTTIEGRFYLPSDFDTNKKYPMIVYYYGGTTPVQRTFSSHWNFHFWASMGYVVYVLEPSGTIGYGQKFSARHVNAWGDYTADDIIQGVRTFCDSHPYVDSKRVGCLGASYGGFMTMYLLTKTNIFATAISHAGISALSSYWGNGYWGYEYSSAATADTYPWNNPNYYTQHSPLFKAEKINTPLLLIQGETDTNVPVGESQQMFTALRILGKTVSLIRIKDEDHIISDYKHKKDWNYSIMAWMAKYLQNDELWWKTLYPESDKKVQ